MSGRPSWKSAEIGLFRPFSAFVTLFRRVRRAPEKYRKRKRKAFFLRYPHICLSLISVHFGSVSVRFGSVWVRFGSVSGPFRGVGGVRAGLGRGASVREKNITTVRARQIIIFGRMLGGHFGAKKKPRGPQD